MIYNERIDEVLLALAERAGIGPTDDDTLVDVVSQGLWAGFYLAQRHPEWLAELVLEANAIIEADIFDPEFPWTEQQEWESNVDRLANGERPL